MHVGGNDKTTTTPECLIENDLIKLYIRRVLLSLNPNRVTMTFRQLWTLNKQALQARSLVGVYTEAVANFLTRTDPTKSTSFFSTTSK